MATFWRKSRCWLGAARRRWRRPSLRKRIPIVLVIVLIGGLFVAIQFPPPGNAVASNAGDGILLYGQSANTTPKTRTYTSSSNSFGSAGDSVAGGTGVTFVTRTSPIKQEAMAGYVDAGGTLRVMCYDGANWTNEWNVSVGGTGTTRRFDIAYETRSGNAMVLYSANAPTTNEMLYKTHFGTSGCGSGWTGAVGIDPGNTSGTVESVKLAWDKRSDSNTIAAAWSDSNNDLSAMTWTGAGWTYNEPAAALEASLDVIGAGRDLERFDIEYETLSGEIVIAWGREVASGNNGAFFAKCTGGTPFCTWSSPAAVHASLVDDATNLDLSADPGSDEIVFASIGHSESDLQAAWWNGSSWAGATPDVDTSSVTPAAGYSLVKTGWLRSATVKRSVIVYADASVTTTSINAISSESGTFVDGSIPDFVGAPTPGAFRWFDIQTDPRNTDRMLLTYSDANADLFSKRLIMTTTPGFTWSNADGGSAALETSLSQATAGAFSFAYWRSPPKYAQNAYRWYQNTDAVQPTTAYADQNTAATINSVSSPVRLRSNLSVSAMGLPVNGQNFKLQYGTSPNTNGTWADVSSVTPWCNTASPLCNTSWLNRKKVMFNNAASATNLTDFPVAITLNSSNIDYSKTKNAGEDIRFTDSNGTALNYEIETWNESGDSVVWVKVPQIDASSNTDSVWLYYNNAAATDAQSKTAVWDANTAAAYHLKEDPTPKTGSSGCNGGTKEACDSTSNANHTDSNGSMTSADSVPGIFGKGIDFDRVDDYLAAPDHNSLNIVTNLTLDLWIKPYATAWVPLPDQREIRDSVSWLSL